MPRPPGERFGALLKRYRGRAGLTQEELAEAARLSVRGLSDLERGVSAVPRASTVQLLAVALRLSAAERDALEQAARRQGAQASAPAAHDPEPRTNLPIALTSFVGREQDQALVRSLLREARLLTLVGTGGCGKTRLALQVAGAVAAEYPDGVWLVELAALSDPALVAQALAGVLGVGESPGQSPRAALTEALSAKQVLVVLDNCEHLIHTCAEVTHALLQSCRDVRVLATSREPLGVPGERTWRVRSLSFPHAAESVSPAQAAGYEAVRLFVERAQAVRPDFVLTAQNVGPVVQVCRRLDGIPLAIELAAARLSALSMETLAARLDDRFRLLTHGPRTTLPRQQTLRATLDWSYDLLGEQERTLLRRLAVFAGSWTLEAAEAVLGGPADGADAVFFPKAGVLDALTSLVAKSLAHLDDEDGGARYRLLETVRAYGLERLEASGEQEALRARHADHYLDLAERAEVALRGPEEAAWLARLDRENGNLRAALQWLHRNGLAEQGLRLAGALFRFWYLRGHLREGRGWLEALLAFDRAVAPPVQAKALKALGVLLAEQGEYERARLLCEDSLRIYRTLDDAQDLIGLLHSLGVIAQLQGDVPRAGAYYEESLALARAYGRTSTEALLLSSLGVLAREQGDRLRAETLYEQSLALYRAVQGAGGAAMVLLNLGDLARDRGDVARATALYRESLAMDRGAYDWAHPVECLEKLAGICCVQGHAQRAAYLLGASAALREARGTPMPPSERADYARDVAAARAALGDHLFDAAWVIGSEMSLEQAIACACAEEDAPVLV